MGSERVDLRSDTVTQPTPSMRRAMAEAEVGDDGYGEDRAFNELEAFFALDHLASEGILAVTIALGVVGLATHHDLDDHGLERAAVAIANAPDVAIDLRGRTA